MIFKSPVVVKYILSGARVVATIRDCGYYSAKVGKGVLLKLGDRRLRGKVLKVVGLDMAREFVTFSGFSTVEEWLNEARRLHGRDDLSGLCIVVVELHRPHGDMTKPRGVSHGVVKGGEPRE